MKAVKPKMYVVKTDEVQYAHAPHILRNTSFALISLAIYDTQRRSGFMKDMSPIVLASSLENLVQCVKDSCKTTENLQGIIAVREGMCVPEIPDADYSDDIASLRENLLEYLPGLKVQTKVLDENQLLVLDFGKGEYTIRDETQDELHADSEEYEFDLP
jgi:hypothetical protein